MVKAVRAGFWFALLAAAWPVVVAGQPADFRWAARFGGSGSSSVRGIAAGPNGDVWALIRFQGVVDFDPGSGNAYLTSMGGYDVAVVRLTPDGDLAWLGQIGGPGDVGISEIERDAAGNLYLGGGFEDTVDLDPGPGENHYTAEGPYDSFVVKLDMDGGFVWAAVFAGAGFVNSRDMTVDSSGQAWFIGTCDDGVDVDPGPGVTAYAGRNFFVVKLAPNGTLAWSTTLDVGDLDEVGVDTAGSPRLFGTLYGVVDLDPGPGVYLSDEDGPFALGLSDTGAFQWAVKIEVEPDPPNGVFFESVAAGLDGEVFFSAHGSIPNFVGKLGPAGETIWLQQPETSGALAVEPCGNLFVAEFSNRLKKLDDADGRLVWDLQFPGPGSVHPNDVALDLVGGIVLAGFFSGTVDLDPGPGVAIFSSGTSIDAFVVAFSQPPSIELLMVEDQLRWPAGACDAGYDMVRGELIPLLDEGDFGSTWVSCLTDDHPRTNWEDSLDPDPGEGYWYLVRGGGVQGPSTYDSWGSQQVSGRDEPILASGGDCP